MAQTLYADIILPLAVRGRFTYSVPPDIAYKLMPGMRVTVPFGKNRFYTGIVYKVHENQPSFTNVRTIENLIDSSPSVSPFQLELWTWISEYYMCNEGEVMKAALPSEISLNSYKPKQESYIRLARKFKDDEMNAIIDSLRKAPRQQELILAYLSLSGFGSAGEKAGIRKSLLLAESRTSPNTIDALISKGIVSVFSQQVSRIASVLDDIVPVKKLSEAQALAYESVKTQFKEKEVVLLHGITSSGKTEIYIHLIEEQLKKDRQVLYMLPEIALTTQIIRRLKMHFGDRTGVYHSRLSDSERAEIWQKVAGSDPSGSYRLILGVRSSVFLPFNKLGLVIVDEEHDGSYKQNDPAPRYHARDTAVILASLHKAKTILGSASPSVESYYNALRGKYGLAELMERFGLVNLPEIILANTRDAYKRKMMVSHFTPELLHAIDDALRKEEQIILFQNRRGFSPYIECSECGWIPVCIQCAVNLTYHKSINRMICHYCGYSSGMPSKCAGCNSTGMVTRGFGTEKIEDEIRIVFPSARVARMDQDTTRGKNSFNKIIKEFENKKIDILIGTQMISKGLDFENLTVVGVLNADNLLHYPDFRAHERSFQMLEQVSGRAGRRSKQGRVVIQTSDPDNRIIRLVLLHDYKGMFNMQAEERKAFNYPPFTRMVRINVKHKDRAQLNHYSDILGDDLKRLFGKRILGPEFPVISQIQLWYIKTILIKIERDKSPSKARQLINEAVERVEKEKGASTLRISVDVDPY